MGAVVLVAGLFWALRKHLDEIWINRLIGFCGGVVFIFVILSLVFLLRTCARWIRTRQHALPPEKGFLDYKLDAETAILALPASMVKLAVIMNGVAKAISKHTRDFQGATSTAQQLDVIRRHRAVWTNTRLGSTVFELDMSRLETHYQ